jgi:hypothetical protein
VKTNNVSDFVVNGSAFNWNLLVSNIGSSGTANFANNNVILRDFLPTSGATYGAVTRTNGSIAPTGTINCAIATNTLTCTANGAVTLLAGASFNVSFPVTTTATGLLVNPATGGCSVDPDTHVAEGNETNNACSNTVTVLSKPDLTVVKTDNTNGSAFQNTPFAWTLLAANAASTSTVTFTDGQVILKDDMPSSGATYGTVTETNSSGTTGTISCSVASNTLTCTANGTVSIPSGESFSVVVNVTPTAAPGSLVNPRTGAGFGCSVDPNNVITEETENNNSCADTVAVTANTPPDLTASKTNNVSGALAKGNSFNWTVRVGNAAGAGTASFASGVTMLTDDLPNGPTYGTVTVSKAGGTTGTVACSIIVTELNCTASGGIVTIPAGGSFSAVFSVTQANAGYLVNPDAGSGDVCQADPDNVIAESGEANNTCANTVLFRPTSLSISKSFSPNPILAGGTTVLTFTITNPDSGMTQSGVAFSDTLPSASGQQMVVVTPSGLSNTCGGTATAVGGSNSISLSGGTIIASGTCTMAVTVRAPVSGTYNNTSGAVSSTEGLTGNTANASLTVNVAPDLTIVKTHTGNFSQGQTAATYSIIVTNSGSASTSGQVSVVDTLPTGLTATAISGTGWTCVLGTLTCTRSNALTAGTSYSVITVTVSVAQNATTPLVNSVTVTVTVITE